MYSINNDFDSVEFIFSFISICPLLAFMYDLFPENCVNWRVIFFIIEFTKWIRQTKLKGSWLQFKFTGSYDNQLSWHKLLVQKNEAKP